VAEISLHCHCKRDSELGPRACSAVQTLMTVIMTLLTLLGSLKSLRAPINFFLCPPCPIAVLLLLLLHVAPPTETEALFRPYV